MDWRLRRDGERLVGLPVGRVDEASWQDFSDELMAAVREAVDAKTPLVLDLSGLEFMTSKGLRVLTMAKKAAAGAITIHLAAPNMAMRRILSISRYDMLFPVVDSVDQVR